MIHKFADFELKLEKEVEELFYIIEDEGYCLKLAKYDNDFYIQMSINNEDHLGVDGKEGLNLTRSEYYIEFFDRVKEVSKKYNYNCRKNNIGYPTIILSPMSDLQIKRNNKRK